MKANLLEKLYDPEQFQTQIKGRGIPLTELSHDDLLQVACEGMQALERIEGLQRDIAGAVEQWRNGTTTPDDHLKFTPKQSAAKGKPTANRG